MTKKSTIKPEIVNKLSHELFRPKGDLVITNRITYHIPILDEVYDVGFDNYMGTISMLTSVGMDMPLILEELGEDFCTIDDFYLFCKYIAPSVDSKVVSLIFPGLNLESSHCFIDEETNECLALLSEEGEILMTREIYDIVMFCLRFTHLRKRNDIVIKGYSAREAYLEDAWMERNIQQDAVDDDIPSFEDLISTMVNDPGFLQNYTTVFDMRINHFLDAVYRSKHIQNANLLLTSGYSGFGVDLKKINQKELNRFAKLDFG